MQYDQNKAKRTWQATVNNAQGHQFETAILAGCTVYAHTVPPCAMVDKTPEPFRVQSKGKAGIFTGRFTAPAQPDFQGTLADGRSIVFEAKYTTTDRLNREVLTQTQQDTLEAHYQLGAVAAVCAGIGLNFFMVPWPVWRDMKQHYDRKYVTAADLWPYKVRFDGAVRFLDYLTPPKEEAPWWDDAARRLVDHSCDTTDYQGWAEEYLEECQEAGKEPTTVGAMEYMNTVTHEFLTDEIDANGLENWR